MPLTEHHHLFLQAMLLRRAAPRDTWIKIWRKCADLLQLRVVDHEFEAFRSAINKRLEPMGFKIEKTVDGGIGPARENPNFNGQGEQMDGSGGPMAGYGIYPRSEGTHWLGLINTRADASAKLATEFTPRDHNFFRRIVKRIIFAPNRRYCIAAHDAIRIQHKVPNMKKSEAEKLLLVLVKQGWLSLADGIYTLSIRSQLELWPYLEDTFDKKDLPGTCFVCREIVMRGFQCPSAPCDTFIHVSCQKAYSRSDRCPICKGVWSNDICIGQDAPNGDYVSDENEEEEEINSGSELLDQVSQTQTQTQVQTQSGTRDMNRESMPSQKRSRKSTQKSSRNHEDEDADDNLAEGPSQLLAGRSTASRRTSRRS